MQQVSFARYDASSILINFSDADFACRMSMKPLFPTPRTKFDKLSASSDKMGLRSGFHTANKGTKTKTEINIDNIPTPSASFPHLVAPER